MSKSTYGVKINFFSMIFCRTLVPPMIESVNVDFDPGHPRSVHFDIQFSEVGEISAVEIVFEGLSEF